jgi:hypothetical protein
VAFYWVYFFGADNHISRARDIECETDADALAQVQAMKPTVPIELWAGGRLIGRFEPEG